MEVDTVMEIKTNYYKEMFNDFAERHPYLAKDVVKCTPKHVNAIRMTLSDGRMIDYNIRSHTYRDVPKYYDASPSDITDEICREIFAANLVDLMKTKGFSQSDLAVRTGLSTAMISKYMRKQATPSITNLEKIAYALNCTRDELME